MIVSADISLEGRSIAVVGGDDRECEIARLAATTGATVTAFGFPWPDAGIANVRKVDALDAAIEGADYLLLPIPGLGVDGSVFAPAATAPIHIDRRVLVRLRAPGTIILGRADEQLRQSAEAAGATLLEYEDDVELMLLRAPAIVEGALQRAIELSDVTLHVSSVAVVGHGTIGSILARTVRLLGADVHVMARSPVQRAAAAAAGATAHPLAELGTVLAGCHFVFSTVPASVVKAEHLVNMPTGGVVMDLAAPPGGVDLDAAARMGHRTLWARGLGRRAPITVGRSQWGGIAQRIVRIEERRGHAS